MSHKMFRPFIVKVSILGYFPLHNSLKKEVNIKLPTYNDIYNNIYV